MPSLCFRMVPKRQRIPECGITEHGISIIYKVNHCPYISVTKRSIFALLNVFALPMHHFLHHNTSNQWGNLGAARRDRAFRLVGQSFCACGSSAPAWRRSGARPCPSPSPGSCWAPAGPSWTAPSPDCPAGPPAPTCLRCRRSAMSPLFAENDR